MVKKNKTVKAALQGQCSVEGMAAAQPGPAAAAGLPFLASVSRSSPHADHEGALFEL